MERGDFERWLRHVVGDDTLADKLVTISKQKLKGESLREKILTTIESRIKELKGMTFNTSARTKKRGRRK